MDLLAISMNRASIWVFRVDGERVYSINNKSPILEFKWSQGGKYFVCSGEDRAAKVYDSNTGANISSFVTHPELPVSLISWHLFSTNYSSSFDKKLRFDLSSLNILKALPKLSFECELLDQQHGLNPQKKLETSNSTYTREDDLQLDFLLVVNGNSSLSLIFSNCFVVPEIPVAKHIICLKHVMGADFFEQSLLVQDENGEYLLLQGSMSIRETQNKQNFIRVIELIVQMISTYEHINDQLRIISKIATEFIALFDRYLGNYKDSITNDHVADTTKPDNAPQEELILDLCDLLLTGLIPKSSKDFWQNQFGVRGLARLSSVGNNAYDYARETIYAQIILAAQKLIIILSDLQSIAKAEQYCLQSSFGISVDAIDKALAHLKEFIRDLFDFIWNINEEQELFNKFLTWCEVEVVEKLAKNDSDPAEFFKAHPTLDFSVALIIEYFNDRILNSRFMEKFDLECPDLEVMLVDTNKDTRLDRSFVQATEASKELRNKLEKFIAGSFLFDAPTKLELPTTSMVDLTIIDSVKLISSTDKNMLVFIKLFSNRSVKCTIEFPGSVLSKVVLGEDQLLVMHENSPGIYNLDIIEVDFTKAIMRYEETKKLKSASYNSDSFVLEPVYMSINSVKNKSHILGVLVDSSMKKYSVIEI